jgi:hypothetical protein
MTALAWFALGFVAGVAATLGYCLAVARGLYRDLDSPTNKKDI